MRRTWSEYTDVELCDLLRDDHKAANAAFAELYARYSKRIYAYCVRILNEDERAKDAFQETFMKFYESIRSKRITMNVPAYLFRIARNLCINIRRKPASPEIILEDLEFPSEDDRHERNELTELVRTAVELLSEDYREVFILREYDGCSYIEIAEIIEKPVSIVKIRLFRARKQIENILAPYVAEMRPHWRHHGESDNDP